MDLQAGDYIISMHPVQETWNRVADAIREVQDEHGEWHFIKDLQNDRLTATMTYMEGHKLKRTLMIEINGYPKADHVRLELRYTLWPDYNIEVAKAIFEKTVNAIAQSVGSGVEASNVPSSELNAVVPVPEAGGTAAAVYSADSPELPPELLEVGKASGQRVLNVIEICLLLAFGIAVINPFALALLCFFGFPVLVISWSVRDFRNYSATKWQGQSFGMRLLRFTPDIIARLFATAVAMPFIAFGLCAGLVLLGGVFGGRSFHGGG